MRKSGKLAVAEEFPDVMVLAALDRAQRHRQSEPGGAVLAGDIYIHLDVRRNSGAGRRLRKRILALQERGWLAQERRRGAQVWQLSRAGRARLRKGQQAGEVMQLPESPQHTAWREAQSRAAQELDGRRSELREHAEELLRLLDSDQIVSSDVWFGLGAGVGQLAWVVGSMTHCLHEWREPADRHADRDDWGAPNDELLSAFERVLLRTARQGRRNPNLWRE